MAHVSGITPEVRLTVTDPDKSDYGFPFGALRATDVKVDLYEADGTTPIALDLDRTLFDVLLTEGGVSGVVHFLTREERSNPQDLTVGGVVRIYRDSPVERVVDGLPAGTEAAIRYSRQIEEELADRVETHAVVIDGTDPDEPRKLRTDEEVRELARDAVAAALEDGDTTGDLDWTASDANDTFTGTIKEGRVMTPAEVEAQIRQDILEQAPHVPEVVALQRESDALREVRNLVPPGSTAVINTLNAMRPIGPVGAFPDHTQPAYEDAELTVHLPNNVDWPLSLASVVQHGPSTIDQGHGGNAESFYDADSDTTFWLNRTAARQFTITANQQFPANAPLAVSVDVDLLDVTDHVRLSGGGDVELSVVGGDLQGRVRDGVLDLENMEKDGANPAMLKDAAGWRTAIGAGATTQPTAAARGRGTLNPTFATTRQTGANTADYVVTETLWNQNRTLRPQGGGGTEDYVVSVPITRIGGFLIVRNDALSGGADLVLMTSQRLSGAGRTNRQAGRVAVVASGEVALVVVMTAGAVESIPLQPDTTDELAAGDATFPAITKPLGTLYNREGVLWRLAAGDDDPHVYHGTVGDLTGDLIGDATFSWQEGPPSEIQYNPRVEDIGTARPPEQIWLEVVMPGHDGLYDLVSVSRAAGAPATMMTGRWSYTKTAGEPGLDSEPQSNYLGRPFSISAYTDAARTTPLRIVENANRWVLLEGQDVQPPTTGTPPVVLHSTNFVVADVGVPISTGSSTDHYRAGNHVTLDPDGPDTSFVIDHNTNQQGELHFELDIRLGNLGSGTANIGFEPGRANQTLEDRKATKSTVAFASALLEEGQWTYASTHVAPRTNGLELDDLTTIVYDGASVSASEQGRFRVLVGRDTSDRLIVFPWWDGQRGTWTGQIYATLRVSFIASDSNPEPFGVAGFPLTGARPTVAPRTAHHVIESNDWKGRSTFRITGSMTGTSRTAPYIISLPAGDSNNGQLRGFFNDSNAYVQLITDNSLRRTTQTPGVDASLILEPGQGGVVALASSRRVELMPDLGSIPSGGGGGGGISVEEDGTRLGTAGTVDTLNAAGGIRATRTGNEVALEGFSPDVLAVQRAGRNITAAQAAAHAGFELQWSNLWQNNDQVVIPVAGIWTIVNWAFGRQIQVRGSPAGRRTVWLQGNGDKVVINVTSSGDCDLVTPNFRSGRVQIGAIVGATTTQNITFSPAFAGTARPIVVGNAETAAGQAAAAIDNVSRLGFRVGRAASSYWLNYIAIRTA